MKVILSPRVEKELKKLSKVNQIAVAKKIRQIGEINLQEEKLKGYQNIYRIRVGGFRIVYNRFARTQDFNSGGEGKARFQASPEIDSKAVESLKENTPPFQGGEAYKKTPQETYIIIIGHRKDIYDLLKQLF